MFGVQFQTLRGVRRRQRVAEMVENPLRGAPQAVAAAGPLTGTHRRRIDGVADVIGVQLDVLQVFEVHRRVARVGDGDRQFLLQDGDQPDLPGRVGPGGQDMAEMRLVFFRRGRRFLMRGGEDQERVRSAEFAVLVRVVPIRPPSGDGFEIGADLVDLLVGQFAHRAPGRHGLVAFLDRRDEARVAALELPQVGGIRQAASAPVGAHAVAIGAVGAIDRLARRLRLRIAGKGVGRPLAFLADRARRPAGRDSGARDSQGERQAARSRDIPAHRQSSCCPWRKGGGRRSGAPPPVGRADRSGSV